MMNDVSNRPVCDYEGSRYQTEFWEQGGREYEDRVERIALNHLLPESGTLCLEIGAGAGRLTDLLDRFERVILLDYSRTQLQQAQARLGNRGRFTYVVADIYCLPFVAGLFDAAMMVRVIHHLVDPRAALAGIRATLRPHGALVLEFANKRNAKAIMRYWLGQQSWNPFSPEPVEFSKLNFNFHPRSMQSWLREVGFTIGQQRSISHFRMPVLKRIVPLDWLTAADVRLQPSGDHLQLTPSVMLRADAGLSGPIAAAHTFFRCPQCASTELTENESELTCPNCGRICIIRDGIYDFKEPQKSLLKEGAEA